MITAPTTSLSSLPSQLRSSRGPNPNPRRRPSTISAVAYAPAMATTTSSSSLYEVLGLPAGASPPEIKAAYRRLARACHPDVVAVERKETSADLFMRVHTAYTTLSDPDKRAEYDRELVLLSRRRGPLASPSTYAASSPFSTPAAAAAAAATSFSGFRRRTWETDQCW